jgi:hypothetical protein
VHALGGGIDYVPFALQEVKTMAVAEVTREKVLDTITQQVTQVSKELVRRVPNLTDVTVSWLDQFMAGKLVMHVDTQELTDRIDGLSNAFIKLAVGLIVAGMLVGTAVVTSQLWQTGVTAGVLPYLAMLVFGVLLFLGFGLMWRMLHPPRRPYVE